MYAHNQIAPAQAAFVPPGPAAQTSVLVLADRLLTLAQQADRAGLTGTAGRLVQLAHDVFDERAGTGH